MAAPTPSSTITLREITSQNWRFVSELKVHLTQQGNLPPNPILMLETHYSENTSMCAIYADETAVGFIMLATLPTDPANGYYIWRFMIDVQYQWMGFGKQAMRLAMQAAKISYPAAKKLWVMSYPREGNERVGANESPFGFFEKLGFKEVMQTVEEGEIMVMMEVELEEDGNTIDGGQVMTEGEIEESGTGGEGGYLGLGGSMSIPLR